ncbi:MAG: hypothetical protein AB8B56_03955 [Crocinitomicaceae bacterium]
MRPATIKGRRGKEVRQLHKELWEIRRKIWNLPDIELDKPVRHGWYKEIVFTRNLERYKNKPEIEEVVEKLRTYFWGRTKKECEKHWDKQVSKQLIHRDFPTISKKQFNKLSAKAQRLCTPFQYRECRKFRTRFYIRIPKNAYRIKYTRAFITHRKMIDPTLESRRAFIENQLLRNGFYDINEKMFGYKYDDWDQPLVIKDRKKIKQALRQYKSASAGSKKIELWEID